MPSCTLVAEQPVCKRCWAWGVSMGEVSGEFEPELYRGSPALNLYSCTDHLGLFPTGIASIVLASSKKEARSILDKELKKYSLYSPDYTLKLITADQPKAIVLCDGDY